MTEEVKRLIKKFGSLDHGEREKAVLALGKRGITVESFIEALVEQRYMGGLIRENAERALGVFKEHITEEQFQRILDGLNDESTVRRTSCAYALGEIGRKEAVGPLIDILADKEDDVRRSAALALGKLKEHILKKQFQKIIEGLRDKNWERRECSALALQSINDPEAVEPLIETLKQKDKGSYWDGLASEAAAIALGKLGDVRAVEPLIEVISCRVGPVISGAAEALGLLGDARAVEPLIERLWSSTTNVYIFIGIALKKLKGHITEEQFQRILDGLNDESWARRRNCANALGDVGRREAIEHLIPLLTDGEDDVRNNAIESIAKLTSRDNFRGMQDIITNRLSETENRKFRSDLMRLFERVTEKGNGFFEAEAKKLKLPRVKKSKKPGRRMWRLGRAVQLS